MTRTDRARLLRRAACLTLCLATLFSACFFAFDESDDFGANRAFPRSEPAARRRARAHACARLAVGQSVSDVPMPEVFLPLTRRAAPTSAPAQNLLSRRRNPAVLSCDANGRVVQRGQYVRCFYPLFRTEAAAG